MIVMKVYTSILVYTFLKYMTVYDGILRYIAVYDGILKYMKVHTFSTEVHTSTSMY